ncbi:MAG: peroxiredoxin [Microscillaceae bacterium]|nr:peroxiredoxin [Microscillaceae bacterium]
MALPIHNPAPDFTLPSTLGQDFTLSQNMHEKACVLFFYPKDFTPGCTMEACDFRDNIVQFSDLEIDVVGISRDSIETHQKFRKAYNLPFHLLSDTDGKVAQQYGALYALFGVIRRITYLLDKNHTIVAVYENLFDAKRHIKEILKKLK